ncbi:MAG: PepSY domain-containing protein [Dissulfurimicrobium sp.]|uniref:PepSY domain-containing protein n=1 Tax=Dissulfurimicrobium TaxID=1769732 RepID=UPI001EDA52CB|nr:PepSY domain-containing protein [Dissulfurimicrobium hydrothermale]UKL13241.1 PepSY domain-containing protein [Dissulfurimicrobium hydrothermale]
MKRIITIVTIGVALTAVIAIDGVYTSEANQGAATTAARTFNGWQYAGSAKIDLNAARRIAQKAFAGDILSEELEHEGGGSGLRYSFDIRKNGITHEVGVDAVTGKVLENSVEGR